MALTQVKDPAGDAKDDWNGKQAGFRTDFASRNDRYTIQGDLYENIIDTPDGRRSGGNVLGRWARRFVDGSTFQVQAYYDEQRRSDVALTGGGSHQYVKTLDVEAEHVFTWRDNHQIVWGVGYRSWNDYFANNANQPYCSYVVAPKLQKFRKKFAQLRQ